MAGNASLRLVTILIRLAQNWAICKNRYDRYQSRRRRAGASADAADDEGEARWTAYHDHPFPGFVRFVDHHIGVGQDAIRAAALKEFNGEPTLVAKLNERDDKGVTAELFEKLRGEFPEIVARLFGDVSDTNTMASASQTKRPGRKKAGYETVQREAQLAADWKRAKEAGTYKADFAKDNGMTVKKLDALLDRVAWRQRNSE